MAKTSPAVSADSPTIKTTTIREVITPEEAGHKGAPEFFEFVRSIPDEKLGEYMIYLYRIEPGRVQIDHTPGKTFDVPGYGLVSVLDQEGLETVITADCGGGVYALMCRNRRSGEMVTARLHFRIDLPPRNVTPWFVKRGENPVKNDSAAHPQYVDGTAQVAGQAIQTMSGIQSQMMTPMLDMMKTAASTVKDYANRPPDPPDEFTRKMQETMWQRALQPPPDPIETLTRVLALQKELNGGNTNGGGGDLNLEKFRSIIQFVREFAGPGAPAVSAGAEMVRAVPGMISQVVDGIREWRIKAEAERDTVAIMHSQAQPRPAPMVRSPQALPPSSIAPPQNPPASMPPPTPTQPNPTQPTNGAPSIEFVEDKIVEIFRKPVSAEAAASETLDFLDNIVGDNPPPGADVVAELASLGEIGLMEFFQNRPHLRPACVNTGRLIEFVRAFLKLHAQDVLEDQRRAS